MSPTKHKSWNHLDNDSFRSEVRKFFEQNYPSELRFAKTRLRWSQIKKWDLLLSEQGMLAPNWPVEYGGMGLEPEKLIIYIEEQERWGVARSPDMGVAMVGPLLIQHGTEEQRDEYLPRILSCEHIWCQGYSEPDAGSDLAALRTEAIVSDEYITVNGQKTWVTMAQDATHIFLLARTDKNVRKQEGISFLLVPLSSGGVRVRPIKNIAGHEEFCEVFFDDVRVSRQCLVGGINQGWSIAKALLGFERLHLGSPKQSQYVLDRIREAAAGSGLGADARFLDRFTALELDVADLAALYARLADQVRKGQSLGPEISMLKIWATETFSRLADLLVEVGGCGGAIEGDSRFGSGEIDVLTSYYKARTPSIYGGTNEIQRNILASGILRLPR